MYSESPRMTAGGRGGEKMQFSKARPVGWQVRNFWAGERMCLCVHPYPRPGEPPGSRGEGLGP